MNLRRLVLLVLSGVLAVGALIGATVDVHADERDCGSAILARDNSQLSVDTGNAARDDFAVQEVIDDCGHSLLGVRMLCVAALIVAGGLWYWSRREQRTRFTLPGDPIL